MEKCIMTVDDSASVRQMVAYTLKSAGYPVVEAVDGKDALSKLAGSSVHMIITDLNMPTLTASVSSERSAQVPPISSCPSSCSPQSLRTQRRWKANRRAQRVGS